MRNRFNLNEQEKGRIRGLHKNQSILSESQQPGCRPNPSTATFPFQAAGPDGQSYEIQEPSSSFQANMKRMLSGNQGCTALSTKMTHLGTMLSQIMSNGGPIRKFIVVLGKINWLSSFITNNTNSGNGCANCGN